MDGVRQFDRALFDGLFGSAETSPRRRQHHNVHASYGDPCQRLFNVMLANSYIPPHRHIDPPRDEMLVAACGLASLIVFDDAGEIIGVRPFASEKHGGVTDYPLGVEYVAGTWHTIIALSENVILLEVKAGPFDPNAAKEFAPWAPEESAANVAEYLATLKHAAQDALTSTL